MPPPLLPTEVLDFTGLTRLALEDRLQTLFKQVNPNWDDYSSNHPENLLLHGEAFIGSMISGVANERVRQLSWATVSNRLAAIRAGRPVGFVLNPRDAATVDGTFYLPNSAVAAKKVLVPAGTRLSASGVVHRTLVAMDIEIGNNASSTQSIENTEAKQDTFQSPEEANTVLKLSHTPVVEASVVVEADNGVFTRTNPTTNRDWNSFTEMTPDTFGFKTLMDHNGVVYILFGNSINGMVPTGAIDVDYNIGGGEDNSVEIGARWRILDTLYDTDGDPVTVEFGNTTASSGGADEMSVDEARVLGPQAVHTVTAAVNENNFEYAAVKELSAVARGAFMTSEHDSSIAEDAARMYIVAFGTPWSDSGYYPPATPTTATISDVEALFALATGKYPRLMGVTISYLAALFTTINVKAKIYKEANVTATQVKANILEEVRKYFAVATDERAQTTSVDFGYKLLGADGNPDYEIAWSKVFNVVNDTEGVRKIPPSDDDVLLNEERDSIVLAPAYFPLLGSVQVYDMDQGGVEI
jgi:hypothetical protein